MDDPAVVRYGDHLDFPGPQPKRVYVHDDGSAYERADPDEFESFDDVDSTTVDDPGAPQ